MDEPEVFRCTSCGAHWRREWDERWNVDRWTDVYADSRGCCDPKWGSSFHNLIRPLSDLHNRTNHATGEGDR